MERVSADTRRTWTRVQHTYSLLHGVLLSAKHVASEQQAAEFNAELRRRFVVALGGSHSAAFGLGQATSTSSTAARAASQCVMASCTKPLRHATAFVHARELVGVCSGENIYKLSFPSFQHFEHELDTTKVICPYQSLCTMRSVSFSSHIRSMASACGVRI